MISRHLLSLLLVGIKAGRGFHLSYPRIATKGVTMSGSSDLKDRVYLVTGSTDGIGRHTASLLAAESASVIVHGRTAARVDNTVQSLRKETGSDNVQGIVADISSLKGMNSLCDQVLATTDRLDCLINNAGVFEHKQHHSDDGVEYTFAVNVLAPYVITSRLLKLLEKAPDSGGRVVNVASISAAYSVNFDNLQFEKGGYSDHAAYSLSKILMIMYNAELARRVASSRVTCNSLDPGTVNTKMLRAGWGSCGIPVNRANNEFFLATSGQVASSTGGYYVGGRLTSPPPPGEDPAACRRLWNILQEMSGVEY